MKKEHAVIIGFGWVGQANAIALTLDGYQVYFYDVGEPTRHYDVYADQYSKIARISHPLEKDSEDAVYLVCVGDKVSESGDQDISRIEQALASLKGAKGTIILRSTVLPSKLAPLNFDIYLPEFLHEMAAVRECVNPQFIVIGKKRPDAVIPSFLETWRRRSLKSTITSPEDASHIKYLSNNWNSLRIAFTNEFGSSITEPDSEKAVARIDAVMSFIFENQPYRRYGRSFGGNCLPKDARAYTRWGEENGRQMSLMRGMLQSNDSHRARETKYSHLKQWFSNWPEPAGSGWVALRTLGISIKRNLLHPFAALNRRKDVQYRQRLQD